MNPLWAILCTAAVAVVGLVVNWLKQRADQETGSIIQAGRDAAVSAVAEARIAKAVVEAPDTKAEVVEVLRKGGF